jgi:hypothetical protein
MPSATRVAENAAAFDKLAALVRHRVAAERFDSAAAWARVAASFATTNPTGELRDVQLERALDAVSRAALAPTPPRAAPSDSRRRVLHVLSEAPAVGGHARMALRWMRSDESSVHHVVVTRPGFESVELAEAARGRGGWARVLEQRSLVDRARELRAATADADVVVCHTHPDDPIPTIAFGGDYAGPPIVMVNHADHVFWLGVGNVSLIMCLRDIGAEASISARGYPADNVIVVPTPLPDMARRVPREAAKRQLGIDASQVVLLTLARGVKYAPAPWHPGFVEVVGAAIRESPRATLLAVGPDPTDGPWAALAREVPGRVLVPGAQPDPSVYLDAADIHLDSFPFSSITSMLEAATRDVPIVASRAYAGMSRLMSSTGPLDDVVAGAADTASYHRELGRLIDDAGLRARTGARTGEAVRSRHGSAAWRVHLPSIYDRARAVAPVRTRSAPEHDPRDLDRYAEALLGIEMRAPLLWTIGVSRPGFDAGDRASALARTTLVRVAQRVRGTGAGRGAVAGSVLIPSAGRP